MGVSLHRDTPHIIHCIVPEGRLNKQSLLNYFFHLNYWLAAHIS